MIHRDAKPEFTLTIRPVVGDLASKTPATRRDADKLADTSGFASGLNSPKDRDRARALGTPGVSPELAGDAATADNPADIYSLGCKLTFVTGRPRLTERPLSS